MVTVVEDHRVPGHSSRWPHHFHLLHLNPARSNEKCCEEDNTYKPAVYEKNPQQLETSSLVDAVEANRECCKSSSASLPQPILPEK